VFASLVHVHRSADKTMTPKLVAAATSVRQENTRLDALTVRLLLIVSPLSVLVIQSFPQGG